MGIEELPVVVKAILFICSMIALAKGADWLVDGGSEIAKYFAVSELVVGLTIVAFGTSAPELAVSTAAAFDGKGDVALANVVGSNIFNLGFILALCAIYQSVHITKELLYRDASFLLFSVCLLLFFVLNDGHLSSLEGALLFSLLLCYLSFLWCQGKSSRKELKKKQKEEETVEVSLGLPLLKCVVGLSCLLLGSKILVDLLSSIALLLGMSEWLVGVTIVAAGTSLPELVTALTSLSKGKAGIGIGNLIGSDIFNILGVMGIASMLSPIQIFAATEIPLLTMLFVTVLLLFFMRTGWLVSRREGYVLFLVSVARWALEFAKV